MNLNPSDPSVHLFLFAHQDDEMPALWEIERLARQGQRLCLVYLTTGQASAQVCERRNHESLSVLQRVGVDASQVWFLGGEQGIPDGQLQQPLERAWQALVSRFEAQAPASLHLLAWEGGHQDHDASHLLGMALAQRYDRIEQSYQVPYYHGKDLPGILFKVLAPLTANGPDLTEAMPLSARWRYLRFLLAYRSQLTTWIGLGPFFLLHYLLPGTLVRQRLSRARLDEKPHPGPMLYERRGFSDYERFLADTAAFKALHLR